MNSWSLLSVIVLFLLDTKVPSLFMGSWLYTTHLYCSLVCCISSIYYILQVSANWDLNVTLLEYSNQYHVYKSSGEYCCCSTIAVNSICDSTINQIQCKDHCGGYMNVCPIYKSSCLASLEHVNLANDSMIFDNKQIFFVDDSPIDVS